MLGSISLLEREKVSEFRRWLLDNGWRVWNEDPRRDWELIKMMRETDRGSFKYLWVYDTSLPGDLPVFDMAAAMADKFYGRESSGAVQK